MSADNRSFDIWAPGGGRGFLYYVFSSKSLAITYINDLLGTKWLKLSRIYAPRSVCSEMKDGVSHANGQETF